MPVPTQEQLQAYANAPSQIVAAIEGLDEKQLHYTTSPEEWSIHEVVVHLADSEVVGYWRVRRILAEQGSTLPAYDEAAWAKNLSYSKQDRELALALFSALRASTASLFQTLPTEAWEYTGIHEERGKMRLHDIFKLYTNHGAVHLAQIERLKQAIS